MNNKINKIFSKNKNILIPFITAGFPRLSTTLPLLQSLAKNGAKIIEIGIPFSDPMADGAVIEAAGNVAINNGANLKYIFEQVHEFRKSDKDTAIVLMGYQNSIEQYAKANINIFAKDCVSTGVDGVLIVDCPPEESTEINKIFDKNKINLIRLISPTTSKERAKIVLNSASGYLYFVSLKGVTGAKTLDINVVKKQVNSLRKLTKLPIVVGFGVRDRARVQEINQFAQGAVIGTKIIEIIKENNNLSDAKIAKVVGEFINSLR